ncbi:MAG: AhpC/TSA family protein [Pseudomonadales bacterium]|nr:AhpC/TSA family protein [Pseudomonadales bacterium]
METSGTDLSARLAKLRATHCDQLPTPQMAVLTRLTARLRRSGILNRCLQPGETAPDFSFIDAENNQASLYELLESGPVVINFYRGLWCPYCKTELEAFEAIRDELESIGCHYLALTPQHPPEETSGPLHLIFDRNNQIARTFDLVYSLVSEEIALFDEWGVHIDEVNESGNWDLPLPATYVIATDRTVAFQFVDVDFRTRCCPNLLVDEVKALLRQA